MQEQVSSMQTKLAAKQARIDALEAGCLHALRHHQGGSSEVGQPLRKLLGIGRFDSLPKQKIESAAPLIDDENWMLWNGGDMPVAEGVFVDVHLREGKKFMNYAATEYRWNHENTSQDIIAYRVVR